ncbi:glycosyltransferase family 4 protein [Blautia sp.]|uniref:glycosyltransferase family 4 protein n=1 Tax=Blautia sp. TaxID=1955243 RepID=UPI0025886044|nr:glycosyltransferase family 4 protein [Blautia sp.]
MKILVVHNLHRTGSASGDDQVFKNETKLLQQKGIEVIPYTVINDKFDQAGAVGKILMTLGMMWSFENYKKIEELIKREKPDIMHVHTFFPLLSPSILYAAKKYQVKVVATLHDTRFICPCATSLRNGKICNLCGDGKYFRMVKYGCFKNSRFMSLVVATIFKYHRIKKSFYKQIDKYICLNDEQIELLENIGFDKEKIVKKYNFVSDAGLSVAEIPKNYTLPEHFAVFYGRIGEEKGIRILQKVWDTIEDIPLVVMGGGPLEEEFRVWADKKANVFYLGYVPHEVCMAIAERADFALMPSIWYEGCSMVAIETESLGIPLITTDIGFFKEAIQNGKNGIKIPLGDIQGFREAIMNFWENPEKVQEMGQNARTDYEKKYVPEDNVKQLLEIYVGVLGEDGKWSK